MIKVSYEELISDIKERFEESDGMTHTLVIEIYCKYSHEDEYEHLIEVCGYEQDSESVVWFNDWYEGQTDIELHAIFTLESLVNIYNAAFKSVSKSVYNSVRIKESLFEFGKGENNGA